MRAVLETNVVVSGIFWRGYPSQILKAWRDTRIKLVYSMEIMEELSDRFPDNPAHQFLDLLAANADCFQPAKLPHPVSRDAQDDKFLACALAAKAAFIITGDKDLLVLSPWKGVEILKPRAFVDGCL